MKKKLIIACSVGLLISFLSCTKQNEEENIGNALFVENVNSAPSIQPLAIGWQEVSMDPNIDAYISARMSMIENMDTLVDFTLSSEQLYALYNLNIYDKQAVVNEPAIYSLAMTFNFEIIDDFYYEVLEQYESTHVYTPGFNELTEIEAQQALQPSFNEYYPLLPVPNYVADCFEDCHSGMFSAKRDAAWQCILGCFDYRTMFISLYIYSKKLREISANHRGCLIDCM